MSAGNGQRRWVNEAQVLAELERLSDLSMAKVAEYAEVSQAAAEAEADYKRLKAKSVLTKRATAKAEGERASVALAETMADADDEVASAYLLRLTTAAQTDAVKEALRTIRGNQEALRTAAASARDGVAGPGWSGR